MLRFFKRQKSAKKRKASATGGHFSLLINKRIKATYRGPWRRFWLRHPIAKRISILSSATLVICLGLLVARLWITANKIIVHDGSAAALTENVDPSQLNGEGDGRVNVLLIGVGGEGHVGGDLSDSIMIVSIDPLGNRVTMLSIPRDLYVPIPGFGSAKINAAHAYGEQYGYKGGGPKLLSETISQALGIPIHYYARVDFDAFKEAVSTVGGVDIDVKASIYDYSYPDVNLSGYDPFVLTAGRHHMDGETALKYVRSRYSTSDFDRSERQQQLLTAFRDKALTISTLTNPIKINSLLNTAGNHARTSLSLDEILKLIDIGKKVTTDQITRAALNDEPDNYLVPQTIGGAAVLVPKGNDFTKLRRYVRSLMPDGYIAREGATVAVLNGTTRVGLADETAAILRSYGYKIVKVGNAAGRDYSQTQITDYTGRQKPYTMHYLERRFGVRIKSAQTEMPPADLVIILGRDYKPVE